MRTDHLEKAFKESLEELYEKHLLFDYDSEYWKGKLHYHFHYHGYDGVLSIELEDHHWYIKLEDEDLNVVERIHLVRRTKNGIKEIVSTWLESIKKKQRIKGVFNPNSYFYKKEMERVFNSIRPTFFLDEKIHMEFLKGISPIKLEEKAAKIYKEKKENREEKSIITTKVFEALCGIAFVIDTFICFKEEDNKVEIAFIYSDFEEAYEYFEKKCETLFEEKKNEKYKEMQERIKLEIEKSEFKKMSI